MKDFVNCVKAKAPTNVDELFDAIVDEGEVSHKFALRADLMQIPFLPYKQVKDGKESKPQQDQKSKDSSSSKGGGGAHKACPNSTRECAQYLKKGREALRALLLLRQVHPPTIRLLQNLNNTKRKKVRSPLN